MVEDTLTHAPAKVGVGQSPELLVLVGVPPGTHRRCDIWFLATRFRVWGRLVATGVRDKESKNSGARQSVVLDRILPRLTCPLTSGATSQTPVPAVACPPLAGFLASPEFPVLRSIISSLDFSTLSSPREPRFRLDSRAPHVSFRLLPRSAAVSLVIARGVGHVGGSFGSLRRLPNGSRDICLTGKIR